MRLRSRIICILFLLLISLEPVFARNTLYGIELCDSVFNFLKKNGFSPVTQSLVASGENAFPYNINVNLPPANGNQAENLVFVIHQEDVSDNQTAIKEILSVLYNTRSERDFNIIVLFAYGEKQKIEKQDMIFGTQVFLESINSNQNYTVIIFDLDNDKNTIETISAQTSSPSWLIQLSWNSCVKAGINPEIPRFFVSQISSYNFISNRQLTGFFENDIPAILIKLSPSKDLDSYSQIIKKIMLGCEKDFEALENRNWERHFFMVKLFGKLYILAERAILKIILPVIMLWLFYIFILIFVNFRLKHRAWSTIRKIWYTVPIIYANLVLSFFAGRFLFMNIGESLSDTAKIYGIISVQIITSLFLLSCFFVLLLSLNYTFDEKPVDYLLVICCFINQSVFVLIDISLSPIFVTICLLSFIALTVKNNALHVIIFILMILPLIPYGNAILTVANPRQLALFIEANTSLIFLIPLVIYPIYLIIFRTLTSIRSHHKRKIFPVVIGSLSYFVFVSAALIILCVTRTKQINQTLKASPVIALSPQDSDLIDITYSDTMIFDDLIRTLNIELETDCILCDVQITSQSQTPILYTDNDYKITSANSVRFSIPDYPPEKMTFSYGTTSQPCKIIVSAVIENENDGTYKFISKNFKIGDME